MFTGLLICSLIICMIGGAGIGYKHNQKKIDKWKYENNLLSEKCERLAECILYTTGDKSLTGSNTKLLLENNSTKENIDIILDYLKTAKLLEISRRTGHGTYINPIIISLKFKNMVLERTEHRIKQQRLQEEPYIKLLYKEVGLLELSETHEKELWEISSKKLLNEVIQNLN